MFLTLCQQPLTLHPKMKITHKGLKISRRGNYAKHAAIWGLGEPSRAGEIAFYSTMAKKYGREVLSLMCATGEIARGMAGNGFHVTAVDLAPEMIAVAKTNNHGNINPCYLIGDITNLNLSNTDYNLAFIGTGDFHHLLTEYEMRKALSCIHKHLSDNGCLALELFYPGNKSWHSPKQRFDLSGTGETGLKAWKIGETAYHADTMREYIRQEVFVEKQGKVESFLHELDLQLFTRETLIKLMTIAGFEIINEYGGFDFNLWRPGAAKWIVESIKR